MAQGLSLTIEISIALFALYLTGAALVTAVFAYHFSRRKGHSLTDYETLTAAATAAVLWPALLYALIADFANQY